MKTNLLFKVAEKLDGLNPNIEYKAEEKNGIAAFYYAIELLDKLKIDDTKKHQILFQVACHLNLTADEVFSLFTPLNQEIYLPLLDENVSPKAVAENIRAFLALKGAENYEPIKFNLARKKEKCKVITFKPHYHEERKYANYMS